IGGESIEHLLAPDPVLQHLRWRFDKISGDMSAGKAAVLRAGRDLVQGVAEFVEKRFHIGVRHERRLVRARRRKITKQRRDWPLIFSVSEQLAADDRKLGEVIEFSFTRKHVEIEHA